MHARKRLLKTAIDTSELLKNYDEIKNIRSQKIIYLNKLKKELNEIIKVYSELEKYLPLTKKIHISREKIEKEAMGPKIGKPFIKKPTTKLEQEILEIKNKLKSLT